MIKNELPGEQLVGVQQGAVSRDWVGGGVVEGSEGWRAGEEAGGPSILNHSSHTPLQGPLYTVNMYTGVYTVYPLYGSIHMYTCIQHVLASRLCHRSVTSRN